MLPRTANIKQETSLAAAEIAAAEIAVGNDRIIVHEYITNTNRDSTRADIIRSFGVQIMAACSYSKLLNKSGIDY